MIVPNPWSVLGIEPTQDVSQIRRAYATALKRSNPEQDAAAFASLRQAYEQALINARLAVRTASTAASAVPAAPAPAVPDPSVLAAAPATVPDASAQVPAAPMPPLNIAAQTLARLRSDFLSLQQTLTVPGPLDLDKSRSLLESCLTSPALENLGVQLDFELAMVQFLWQTRARSEPLLEIVIDRWKWRERGRSAVASREIAALILQADDVVHLERVRESARRAYEALTQAPRPIRLWLQIVTRGLHKSVREVLDQFRGPASCTPSALNAQALLWWQRFFTQPHIRPEILKAAGVMALIGLILGPLTAEPQYNMLARAWQFGLLFAGATLVLAGLWFALIDWPRFRLKSFRRIAPRPLRLGWAPAILAPLLLSPFLPDNVTATTIVSVICLCLVGWAILMAPESDDSPSSQRILQHVGLAVFVNAPLALWWAYLASQPTQVPTAVMLVSFVTSLAVFAIGQRVLWGEFLRASTLAGRQLVRVAVGAFSLATLPLFLYMPETNAWQAILASGTVVVVLIHRTPAVNLTVRQLKFRHYFTLIPTIVLANQFSRTDLAPGVRFGGILFMSGVTLTMATSLYNEWKSREVAPADGVDLRTRRAHL